MQNIAAENNCTREQENHSDPKLRKKQKWLKINPTLQKKNICKALGTTTKRITELLANDDIQPVNPIHVQILTESALKELLSSK